MSTELATHAFEPGTTNEALTLAKILIASRLLPKSVTTAEAAFTIIATGRELGLTALQALRSIHVIEGKCTLSSDLMLALVKRAPECQWFRLVSTSVDCATYETQRRGEPEPTRMSFTIAEAQTAGLASKDNWKKYAPAMLRARCIAALARAVYPDLMMGVYEADELGAPTVSTAAYGGPVDARPTVVTADGEVIEAAQPASPFVALLAKIIDAPTLDALQAASRDVAQASKAGMIHADERSKLVEAGRARKLALGAPVSSPEVAAEAAAQ